MGRRGGGFARVEDGEAEGVAVTQERPQLFTGDVVGAAIGTFEDERPFAGAFIVFTVANVVKYVDIVAVGDFALQLA
jgi:hypothetical protein